MADVGAHRPLHCTAAGKVMLAFGPPPTSEGYLAQPSLRACSAHTLTDPDRLRAELLRIRRLGYATSMGSTLRT